MIQKYTLRVENYIVALSLAYICLLIYSSLWQGGGERGTLLPSGGYNLAKVLLVSEYNHNSTKFK